MKRLIAKRPIQYMGRTYDVCEALPAYDSTMVAAWLAAGSAEWAEEAEPPTALSPDTQAAAFLRTLGVAITDDNGAFVGTEALEKQITVAPLSDIAAADVLRAMGVVIMDDVGEFVGTDKLVERIRAAVADDRGDSAEGKNGESAEPTKILTGHLDTAQLERMTKDDLIKLAADLRVDISTAKNNADRAAMIAAVEVRAPTSENLGAQ